MSSYEGPCSPQHLPAFPCSAIIRTCSLLYSNVLALSLVLQRFFAFVPLFSNWNWPCSIVPSPVVWLGFTWQISLFMFKLACLRLKHMSSLRFSHFRMSPMFSLIQKLLAKWPGVQFEQREYRFVTQTFRFCSNIVAWSVNQGYTKSLKTVSKCSLKDTS